MGDLLKSVSEFFRLNWRNAFALFASGVVVLVFRSQGFLQQQDELIVGAIAAFGFWTLVTLGIDRARAWKRAKNLKTKRAADSVEKAESDRLKLKSDRLRAVENLGQIHDWEFKALVWIYHRHKGRARASINHSGIGGLRKMGLLEFEEQSARVDYTDCFFVIPDTVYEMLEKRLGPPNKDKTDAKPPWDRNY